MGKLEYDIQKRARAGTAATFRAVVAGYIIYLGWKIATAEGSSMPPLAAKLIGVAFITAALAFGVYTWKRWRLDLEAARLPETEDEEIAEEIDDGEDAEP